MNFAAGERDKEAVDNVIEPVTVMHPFVVLIPCVDVLRVRGHLGRGLFSSLCRVDERMPSERQQTARLSPPADKEKLFSLSSVGPLVSPKRQKKSTKRRLAS